MLGIFAYNFLGDPDSQQLFAFVYALCGIHTVILSVSQHELASVIRPAFTTSSNRSKSIKSTVNQSDTDLTKGKIGNSGESNGIKTIKSKSVSDL